MPSTNNTSPIKNISPSHESAHLHVSGEAIYVDDIAEVSGTLFAALGLSERPHAKITTHGFICG